MSFPASLTTRTVKGRFVTHPQGKAARGTVRIVLNDFMQGPSDDLFVAPFDITIPLDGNGSFSTVLPATDDPAWTPSSYKIIVTIENDKPSRDARPPAPKILRHSLNVSHTSTEPIDLADVVNIPAPLVGVESYILLASKGVPGGVAVLGEDGKVLPSQLPPASGGEPTVGWDDVEDKPSTFPPSTHSHVTEDIEALDTALASKAHVNHNHDFEDIANKPATYPHAPIQWAEVEDKPTSFPGPSIVHVQSQPSTSWGVVHSFGRQPNVVIVIDGESVMADVKYPTETTVAINFGAPQTGKAVLT
jgi:hypothetical protein